MDWGGQVDPTFCLTVVLGRPIFPFVVQQDVEVVGGVLVEVVVVVAAAAVVVESVTVQG